ncbi:MAG: sugar transferase [Acidimicrobiia bacterium]|nr:sugar transferase [Acidimicrobiia bacterium]
MIFKQTDESGEVTQFSIAARGILVTIVSIAIFNGLGYVILSTNLGKRLAFLIGGTATFGWMAIGGALFVIYAPRGIRPANLEGLNAFQIRIPAIAVTLGSLILFVMFVVALDRYEREAIE